MIDYQTKIVDFSFDELKAEILQDASSKEMLARRYPARFIMLDNFETFRELRSFLHNLGAKLLQFDSLLDDDVDGWLTSDQLIEIIKNTTEPTLITPFSELVRFYEENKFCGFMHDISLLEDLAHPNKRLYMPLIGLENRVEGFLKGFTRIAESAPIWRCRTEKQATRVYLMSETPLQQNSHITVLKNAQEWLQFWKTQAPQDIVICTSRPIRAFHNYSQPDNIFSFLPINDIHQLLTDVMGYSFPFACDEQNRKFWDTLASEVVNIPQKDFSFGSYVCHRFGRYNIDAEILLQLWISTGMTEFDRWVLRQYALNDSRLTQNSYLHQCLEVSSLDNADSLIINIATQIPLHLHSKPFDANLLDERTRLMNAVREYMRSAVPPKIQQELRQAIVEIFQSGDFASAKALCTHTFDFEHWLAAGWYDLHENDSFSRRDLQSIYPDLYGYYGEENAVLPEGCEWIESYFQSYRRAKLSDSYPDTIKNIVSRYSGTAESFYSWYHIIPRAHDMLAQTKVDYVYWIDGLGAEYIPFINHIVSGQKVFVTEKCVYSRADIPSSTTHNRYDLPPEQIFRALDEKAHDSHGYRKYDTLIEELAIMRDAVEKIMQNHIGENCRIAIVSDHGLSFLSRKADSLKTEKTAEHEGRYLLSDNTPHHDTDFVYHFNESDGRQYKIALRHASLGNKPTHEVHGGCTPEEVLVPFIVLAPSTEMHNYTIGIKKNKIPLSNPLVEIFVSPKPTEVKMKIGNVYVDMTHETGDMWVASLPDAKEGNTRIAIQPSGGVVQSFDIEVFGIGFGNSSNMFGF